MTRPHRYTPAEFADDERQHGRLQARLERGAWLLAALLVYTAVVLWGYDALARNDYPSPCPDGQPPTTWCGCLPPIHGDDC